MHGMDQNMKNGAYAIKLIPNVRFVQKKMCHFIFNSNSRIIKQVNYKRL